MENGKVFILIIFSPVGIRGLKSRMCPLYPHACRKRRYIAQVADTALSTNLTFNHFLYFDRPCYTELPSNSMKTEIEN